jgi:hypothetical protein
VVMGLAGMLQAVSNEMARKTMRNELRSFIKHLQ